MNSFSTLWSSLWYWVGQGFDGFQDMAGEAVQSSFSGQLFEVFGNAIERPLLAIFHILPESTGLPDVVMTSADQLGNTLGFLNLFLPVDHMLIIISILVSVQSFLIIFKVAMWVASMIRGTGYTSNPNLDISPSGHMGGPWSPGDVTNQLQSRMKR